VSVYYIVGNWSIGGGKHSQCATLNHAMKSDTLSARVQDESRANLLNVIVEDVVAVIAVGATSII